MLGQFLEYSVGAQPLAASFEFYRALGLRRASPSATRCRIPTSSASTARSRSASTTAHEPASAAHVRSAASCATTCARCAGSASSSTYEHLGDDEFNSVGFTDPGGQAVELLEARTFPPGEWDPHNVTACGEFLELTLPAQRARRDRAASGRRSGSRQSPAARRRTLGSGSVGHGLTLGLHESHCRPGLSFRCANLDARCDYLRAKGLGPRAGSPTADRAQPSATLTAPEGTQLYLLEKGAQ